MKFHIQVLYNKDCISDQAIIYWHQKGSKPQGRQHFLKATEPLIKVRSLLYLTSISQFLNKYLYTVFARTRIQRRRVNSLQGLNSACPVCNFRFLSRDPESIEIHECTAKSNVKAESKTNDFESKKKKKWRKVYHASGMGPNSPVQPFLPTIWRKIPSEPFIGRPRSARLCRS